MVFIYLKKKSNRKLVGTNVSPHFSARPSARPRSSPPLIFYPFYSPFLFSRPNIWAEFFFHQIESVCLVFYHRMAARWWRGDIQRRLMAVMEISHASFTDAPARTSQNGERHLLYSSSLRLCSPYIKFIMIHTSYCGRMDGKVKIGMGGGGEDPGSLYESIRLIIMLTASIPVVCEAGCDSLSLGVLYYVCCTLLLLSLDLQSLCVYVYPAWGGSTALHIQFRIVWFIYDSLDSPSNRFTPACAT